MGIGKSSHSSGVSHSQDENLAIQPGSGNKTEGNDVKTDHPTSSQSRVHDMVRLINAESRRKRAMKQSVYDRKKENLQILKQLFRKMDPSVMKTSINSNHGDVQLSLKYEEEEELLLVKVIRGRNLSARDLLGRTADPYVRLFLHPHSDKDPTRKTQTVKNTLNPVYNEIFSFPASKEQLLDSRIILQVWDKDLMDKDDIIGEAVIPLNTFEFEDIPIYTAWFTLQNETDFDVTGDLELTLKFEPPNKLLVTVHRSNNLTNRHRLDGKPNPFVKIQIPGVEDVIQSEVQYSTVNPVWEQTFEFEVPPEDFDNRYIIFHVVDYDDGDENDSLGQVVIELGNLDPENGFHGAFQLADLKNSERVRARWFQHTTVQEFHEALTAHAMFQCPKFLFTQQTGTKVGVN